MSFIIVNNLSLSLHYDKYSLYVSTEGCISAGHDISDGGLITCIIEMAIAGNCSVELDLRTSDSINQDEEYQCNIMWWSLLLLSFLSFCYQNNVFTWCVEILYVGIWTTDHSKSVESGPGIILNIH